MYIMNTLSATDARNRFFELLDRCYYNNERFLVTKNGRPAARLERYNGERVEKHYPKSKR